MKIVDRGVELGEIRLSENEAFALGDSGYRVLDSVLFQTIFARIWRTAYEAGRAYDPRNEPRQDPMGLVGPSDSERIGHPWCPWCRDVSHYGGCPTDPLLRRDNTPTKPKGRRRGSQDQ